MSRNGGYYMVRTIRSGRCTEKTKFWVSGNTQIRKGRTKGATTQRKQDVNERDGLRRFARSINCNFNKGDYLLTGTYDQDGLLELLRMAENPRDINSIFQAAKGNLENLMKALKRKLGKVGIKPRTIHLTADINEDGSPARIHHHILISGEGLSILEDGTMMVADRPLRDFWRFGTLDWKAIWDRADQTPLAEYLWRQVRRQPNGKKYSPSRNLAKPVLVKEEKHYTERELKVPKGGKLLFRAQFEPGHPQYIRYIEEQHQNSREKIPDSWAEFFAELEG